MVQNRYSVTSATSKLRAPVSDHKSIEKKLQEKTKDNNQMPSGKRKPINLYGPPGTQ